ncbi:unannotated protein [freshwater metagenome]|uniref:Unannotated protein n=1 Tax=freshwater metagenome TaxID=449393 RepID=A0A6J7NJR6_9ZZZZ
MSEAFAVGGAFDKARNVGNHKLKIIFYPNDAEIGFEGGERIISDLGLRCRDARNKGGLADVRESNKCDVSHQLEFEIQPLLLADLSLLGK